MGVAITIRNVPNRTRDELAGRAAAQGKSLQEYLRALLVDEASQPTLAEVVSRARDRANRIGAELSAEAIVAARDADRR
ncbi:MAG TPA: hypothetical protein VJM33_18855 [Microthrixaceae bacterium]|nr:hypothetical protein [Microthrixaceae bacterium]